MMTVNLDIEDGLVNGACGQLIMIDYGKLHKTNETVPRRLWIKFNEEKTGRKARANFHNVMRNRNIDLSVTPIEPVTRQINTRQINTRQINTRQINTRSTNFKVERKQFPLVPSEAMTIYKSQGGTYEKVVVNLKKGMTRSELYVACSRATKASGLYLIGDFVPPKPPERNDAVAMMFKTMRSERMLKFSLEFPEESQAEKFSIMFHYVQSLNKHILDVRSDKTFLRASMISLVETWTKPTDYLEIEGFKVIHRRDCNDTRKPFGQIIYLKNHLQYENIIERYEYSGKDHIEYCSIKIDDICVISVYNSPNSSFDVLKRHMNEVISISKRFCEDLIVVGDLNINLKIKANHKFIEYMESFKLTLINKLNKSSTNAKTQIDYCFTNMNDFKSDYFESLTSFHKPIWINKHGILTESHVGEIKQIRTDIPIDLKNLEISDQSDMMEVDEEFFFNRYKIVDENEELDVDTAFHLEDLQLSDQSDIMEIDEQSSFENYEIIDSTSRNILDHFLLLLDLNTTAHTDEISSQAQIINDLIKKSPFITVHNKDLSVRLKSKTEYSVEAFDSIYARTRTTADGNCLYSSLSILTIGSEKLTHSMRLLAAHAMINKRDYFQLLCALLNSSFKDQLQRTTTNTVWGGEVQIQALSIALSRPIYSYTQFNSDPKNRHYVPLNISLPELVDRFNKGAAGGHLKYVGYKADTSKLAFCVFYNGTHYDALLPFQDNPQQFVPHFDIINMSL